MTDFRERLKQRKLVQWVVAYAAGAWVLLQVLDMASNNYDWPHAVLPLVNQSGDKDQQYFSDGLSEDLIIALSQFGGLKVIGRNSAMR